MKKIILKIDGMTCSACSSGLEKYVKKQKGIINAEVNLILAIMTVEYEDVEVKDIEKYIANAGFKSLGEFKDINDAEKMKSEKNTVIIFGALIVILFYISMAHMFGLYELDMISFKNSPSGYGAVLFVFAIIYLAYGMDILKSGIKNLIHLMPNMDTLVTIGVLSSFIYSVYGFVMILAGDESYAGSLYFESTAMVIYFVKLGRYIENISKDKTKDAIRKLVQITPKDATIERLNADTNQTEVIKVTLDEINKGDTVIARPGEKVAVDGIVISGKTHVDESFITGESMPVLKEKGQNVIAGSINYDGLIKYKAEKIGKDSTISEIVKLVVEATNSKNKIQKIADKISSVFVPVLVGIALLTFAAYNVSGLPFNAALNAFVTVLVVACPCALGLAVPLVIVVSNGMCADKGIFIKKSESLETARAINAVVLDKTGTLTYGKLNIFKTFVYQAKENKNEKENKKEIRKEIKKEKEILKIVKSLELNSSHPIATAFKDIDGEDYEVINFKNIDGVGIEGEINNKKYCIGSKKILASFNIDEKNTKKDYEYLTANGCSILYLIEDEEVIALIGVKDTIRDTSKSFIKKLKEKNIETIMLTGDNKVTAEIVAKELKIDKVISEVMPSNKSSEIKKLMDEGKRVMMVGDGINDAPALVSSTIGVSINDGIDVAIDSADIILMNNDLNNIIDLIDISRKSFKIIKQNLFWAFFYNILMIPIAMGLLLPFGIRLTPMFGSIAMTISSLTVVLNSLRLRKMK